MMTDPQTAAPFTDAAGLARRWGVTVRTIRREIALGRIPVVRPTPNTVRIRWADVAAIEARDVEDRP